jgi:hypothetical protein
MNNLELRIARARLAAMKPFPHNMPTPRDFSESLRKRHPLPAAPMLNSRGDSKSTAFGRRGSTPL